jgi:ubiquinone/menaquinone biosynthesis C-methylase UbiE
MSHDLLKMDSLWITRKRGIRFRASELETGRTYLWRKEFLPLLYKYLELKRGQTIVDVGCGTGSFTRILAIGTKFQGKVIGIDKNRRLISVAKKISQKQRIASETISYKVGKVEALPLPDNFADRVVCQMLLWIVEDRAKAIDEMIRVCKPNGLVGAIDLVTDKIAYYYPKNERLGELHDKYHIASVNGYSKLYGADKNVGYKLPSLFKQRGLKRIRLDGYAYVYLQCDDRIPFDFKLKNEEKFVKEFDSKEERNRRLEEEKILLAGGMNRREIRDYHRLNFELSRKIVRNPKLLKEDTSMNGGLFYITTGIKS